MPRIFSDLLGTFSSTFKVWRATLSSSGLTAQRTYTLPDSSGTLILSSDLTGGSWIFGDGSDGNITLGGVAVAGITTLSGSSPNWVHTLTRDVYADELTVPAGIRLNTANYRVFCRRLSGSGVISNSGPSSANGGTAAINATAAGTLPASGNSGAAGVGTTSATSASFTNAVGGRGGIGGAGGFSTGVSGNVTVPVASAGGLQLLKQLPNVLEARIQASVTRFAVASGGTGGTGATGSQPTAGGAGGGMIVLAVKTWAFTGSVEAIGGSSGNALPGTGANAGSGGSGGGGCICIIVPKLTRLSQTLNTNDRIETWQSPTGETATVNVSGGTVGTPVGTGAAGTRGAAGNISVIGTIL